MLLILASYNVKMPGAKGTFVPGYDVRTAPLLRKSPLRSRASDLYIIIISGMFTQ